MSGPVDVLAVFDELAFDASITRQHDDKAEALWLEAVEARAELVRMLEARAAAAGAEPESPPDLPDVLGFLLGSVLWLGFLLIGARWAGVL